MHYLISKTKTKTAAQIKDEVISAKIANIYQNLNNIDEIKLILQILQYNPYPEVILDFDTNLNSKLDSHKIALIWISTLKPTYVYT